MSLDYETSTRLRDVIDKATGAREQVLDASLLNQIKAICKASDANVHLAFEFIYDRLRQQNSKVRYLALELADELFKRSRIFRHLVAAKFTSFLELVVGFRTDNPLPPPFAVATALRNKALEIVERWTKEYGATYRQVAFGYSYLKDTLKFEFPEVDTRRQAAEAAQAEREARAQHIAQEKYAKLLEDWPQLQAEHASLLQQLNEAFQLLHTSPAQINSQTVQQQRQQEEEEEVEDAENGDWEDIEEDDALPTDNQAAATLGDEEYGGLSSYAPVEPAASPHRGRNALDDGVDANEPVDEASLSKNEALLETLEGLYKLMCTRALPSLQQTLQTVVRSDTNGATGAQHTQREQILRGATDLRQQLLAAKERFETARLDLQCLVQGQQRRLKQQQKAQQEAELMEDLFGPESDTEQGLHGSGMGKGSKQENKKLQETVGQRELRKRRESAASAILSPAANPTNPERSIDEDEEAMVNPYTNFFDPTAPPPHKQLTIAGTLNKRTAQFTPGLAQKLKLARTTSATDSTTIRDVKRSSSLPEHLKKALAAQAPVLPAGAYQQVWDSGAAVPKFVSGHGMEIANHWGPVDVHQELPEERLEELFLLPYSHSGQKQGGKAGGGDPSAAEQGERPNSGFQAKSESAAASRRKSKEGSNMVGNQGAGVAPVGFLADMGGLSGDRRAQRAAERAYNEAVLSGAATDERLAQALQEADGAGAAEEGKKPGKTRKKQIPARERLKKKLLTGRAAYAANNEVQRDAQERERELHGNKWENK